MYFSSDGHPGLGGLDVFAVQLDKDGGVIANLGRPVNGTQDDFTYVINADQKGFVASNRSGGKGNDDIYSFVENAPVKFECIAMLEGQVTDKDTGAPLANATVKVYRANEELVGEAITDSEGKYSFEIFCDESLTLNAEKMDYKPASESFASTKGTTIRNIALEAEPVVAPGEDLVAFLDLAPIYFDLDKSNIRPDAAATLDQVFAFLSENSDIKISVASHTDALSSKSYNQRLSERRAISTKAYLVEKGIAADRIDTSWYGEEKLSNDCTNWSNCSRDENQKNRRSELIVVGDSK